MVSQSSKKVRGTLLEISGVTEHPIGAALGKCLMNMVIDLVSMIKPKMDWKIMSFSIKFINESSTYGQLGEIELGDFNEKISIPMEYWDKEKYEHQWREAIERIITSDNDIKSMLMTSMYDPKESNFLVSWPLYKINGTVYVQNSLIFMETLEKALNEQNIYDSVSTRETISEDTGEQISEWQVSIDDLKQWLSVSSI